MREIQKEWSVKGVRRTAVVVLPPKPEGAPIVFGFHGHGGNGQNSSRRWNLQKHWPEAIFVYPNGLATRTPRDPEGGKPGWQMFGGGLIANRDLDLFEAMLETAKKEWKVDEKQIYCTGHSNGAGFTYYLWGQKPTLFAALAAVAGGGERLIRNAKPCPLLAIGAKNDEIVKWDQQQAVIDAAKKLNGSKAPGSPPPTRTARDPLRLSVVPPCEGGVRGMLLNPSLRRRVAEVYEAGMQKLNSPAQ